MLEKRAAIKKVCDAHRVDLRVAALQFSNAPKAVHAVIPGARNAEQATENAKALETAIPADFWAELKKEKLISAEAEVPRSTAWGAGASPRLGFRVASRRLWEGLLYCGWGHALELKGRGRPYSCGTHLFRARVFRNISTRAGDRWEARIGHPCPYWLSNGVSIFFTSRIRQVPLEQTACLRRSSPFSRQPVSLPPLSWPRITMESPSPSSPVRKLADRWYADIPLR